MFPIYSILLISAIWLKFSPTVESFPLRTDCYESFTYPVIYMPIAHYYPSPPLYLYVKFNYKRHSVLPNFEIKYASVEYSFKLTNKTCESSVTFTTFEDDFEKLDVGIIIYLAKKQYTVGVFVYTFYWGYEPKFYELREIFGYFTIRVKVVNSIQNHIKNYWSLDYSAKLYLKSITTQASEICIITPNNPVVILKSLFEINITSALIVGFEFKMFLDGIFFGIYQLGAFTCNKDTAYPDIPVIFVVDRQKMEVKFRIIYQKYFEDAPAFGRKTFELSNLKYEYADNLRKISSVCHKIFLVKDTSKYIKCPEGYILKQFRSETGKVYMTTMIVERFPTLPKVTSAKQYFAYKLDKCGE